MRVAEGHGRDNYLVQHIWPTTSKGAASIVVHFQKIDIYATFQNNDVGHMRGDIQYSIFRSGTMQ